MLPFTARVRDDLWHAARVATGLLVPGVFLMWAGRPDLLVYAAFGSFTGLYGRGEAPGLRLRHQALGGTILLGATGIGITLAGARTNDLVVVAIAVTLAALVSLVSDRAHLRPEGPFYGLFALGATAFIPIRPDDEPLAFGMCAVAALFALALGWMDARLRPEGATSIELRHNRDQRAMTTHALSYAAAVTLASAAALAVHLHHVNWAIVGAAVMLAAGDQRSRLQRGVHRVIGTMVGLVATYLLLLPGMSPTALALVVIVLLFPTEMLMTRHYALALGFFTPMIMLMTDLAGPMRPSALIVERIEGTLLGVLAGVVVVVAVREPSPSD